MTVSVAVAGGNGGSGFSQTACDTKKIEQFNYKVRMKENSRISEGWWAGKRGICNIYCVLSLSTLLNH